MLLGRDPRREVHWDGVVCFRGTTNPSLRYVPHVSEGGRCLHYGQFAVFDDPDLLEEVRALLAESGHRPARTR